MLGKIMKYEFKSSGRILLPFFGAGLLLSLLIRVMLAVVPHIWEPLGIILQKLAGTLGILLPICIIVLAFVLVVVRFYQSMASNEAYLTFTLPVTTGQHIWGKLIVGVIYSFSSVVVSALCGVIFIPGFLSLPYFYEESTALPSNYIRPGTWAVLGAALIVLLLLGIANSLVHFYASIGIGTQFGRQRILGSVVGYFVLNMASGVISTVFLLLPMFSALRDSVAFENLFILVGDTADEIIWQMLRVTTPIIIPSVLAMLVITAGMFLLTWYLFNKKLNVE